MSVTVDACNERGDEVYVFLLNDIDEMYTLLFEEEGEGEGLYRLNYILVPRADWGVDEFQETIEARNEAVHYLRVELGYEFAEHPMSLKQIVPRDCWPSVETDEELVAEVESDRARTLQ